MDLRRELEHLRRLGRYRRLRTVDGPGPRAILDGQEVIVLCSNDYLGLARHPDMAAAVAETLTHGTGSGASRLISGNTEGHRALEAGLARFKGTDEAILFGSGMLANLGTIPALMGKGDLIFSDEANHASIIDGCRLSKADVEVYPHNDVDALAARLDARRGQAKDALIVTDGVFSMDGDQARLAELADLAEEHECLLMVDDAHGTGVLGPGGKGTAHAHGVADRIDIHMGTLSKAIGAEGGFVAGDADLVDLLRNKARTFIFSTAPSPLVVAAARAGLRLATDTLRERLHTNVGHFLGELRRHGLVATHHGTPIVPLIAGTEGRAMSWMEAALGAGVYAAAIRPPTVPPGSCRIRATMSAAHAPDDLARAAQVLASTCPELVA